MRTTGRGGHWGGSASWPSGPSDLPQPGFQRHGRSIAQPVRDLDCLRDMYLLGFYADDADSTRPRKQPRLLRLDGDRRRPDDVPQGDVAGADGRRLRRLRAGARCRLVLLGIDEHKFVRITREVTQRFGRDTTCVATSPWLRSTRGWLRVQRLSEVSQSVPGSSISVIVPPAGDRHPDDGRPRSSSGDIAVYQLTCQMFSGPPAECPALPREFVASSPASHRARAELAEGLISITDSGEARKR